MTTNKIITYHNVLNPLARTIETKCDYKNIDEILKDLKYDNEIYDLVISKNSEIMEGFFEIEAGDVINIAVVPKGGGGGGKQILGIVAMIVITVVSYGAGAAYGAALGSAIGVSAAAGSAIIAGTIMVAGGLLLNAVMPMANSKLGGFDSQTYERSNTYGWNTPTNQVTQGAVVPKIYGTHKITPPMIGSYIDVKDDKQYFNGLYALNDGEIEDVKDIKINGEPIGNFAGVTYEIRRGFDDQAVIDAFNDTHSNKYVGKKLNPDMSYSLSETEGNAVTGLKITLAMPNGIFYANDQGGISGYRISLQIEYSPNGTDWTTLGKRKVSYKLDFNMNDYITYREGEHHGTWIFTDPYTKKDRMFRARRALEKYVWDHYAKPVYSEPYNEIEGASTSAIRRTAEINNLPPSKYYVRVRYYAKPQTSSRYGSACFFEYLEESISDDFLYPHTALLAVRALATDQLSGNAPRISAVVTANTDNPAEICKQILLDSGVDKEKIMSSFEEWGKFCKEKGYTCNIVFDSEQSVRQALDSVSLLGRASIIQAGSKFDVIMEKAALNPTQSFLFTMGNILSGTFKQNFLPLVDRANFLEITYYDKDKDYEPSVISISNSPQQSHQVINKTGVTLPGCTDEKQARAYGQFQLNCNKYLTETIEFEADKDSLVCRYGDIIKVSHDTPQYGFSGRLAEDSSDVLILDREIETEAGKKYVIQVRNDVNEISEFEVLGIDGNKISLNLNGKAFKKYDNYAFGEINKTSKLYRVLKIATGGELTRQITAIEYNETIYSDTGEIVVPDIPSLKLSNLRVSDYIYLDGSRVIHTMLRAVWGGQSLFYTFSYKKKSDTDFTSAKIYDSSFSFEAVDGETYNIAVSDSAGNKLETEYKVVGKLAPPPKIENLRAVELRDFWSISWEYPDVPIDFSHFEIYENNVLVSRVQTLGYALPKTKPNCEIKVFGVDTSGVKSEAVSANLSVAPLPDVKNFNTIYRNNKSLLFWDEVGSENVSYEVRKGNLWQTAAVVAATRETSAEVGGTGTYKIKAFYINTYGLRAESANAATLIVDENLLPKNVIATIAHPDWNGKFTDTQIFGSALSLQTDVPLSFSFDDIPNVDKWANIDVGFTNPRKILNPIGYFESKHQINLTEAKMCSASMNYEAAGYQINSNFDLFENVDLIPNIDGTDSTAFEVIPQISLSIDGANFGEFKNFKEGDYFGKIFKFRLKLISKFPDVTPLVNKWTVVIDVPDVIESGEAKSAKSEINIKYKEKFSVAPEVQITIVDAQAGDDAVLSNQTAEGFNIKIINDGATVERKFNYMAKGY